MTKLATTKTQAEVKKLEAEARKNAAEAEKLRAEARAAKAEAAEAEIKLAEVKEERALSLASDDFHRVLQFTTEVNKSSVDAAIRKLSSWHRMDLGCDIEIVFMSPGGSVVAGMALFDYILWLRRNGHKVTTRARGYAASMAGILLQAGDVRVMESEAYLLIHRGSAGVSGSMGEIEDTVKWFQKIDKRVLDIFYNRSRNCEKPLTKKTIAKNIERADWWLDADEALRHGFCDEVQ